MKFRQPIVLLFGSLLSASSVGCAAITAVVSEYRPATRETRGSADRLVAIGRVFENQGRLDQAEVMYRRALKQKPQDAAISEQIQRLADARNGRQFEADPIASALATADSVTQTSRRRSTPASGASGRAVVKLNSESTDLVQASVTEVTAQSNASPTVVGVVAEISEEFSALPVQDAGSVAVAEVTVDQILETIDAPDEHTTRLITGLRQAGSLEVQCLAATILAECDPANADVRDALAAAESDAGDERLLLSIAASRNQRGESNADTAGRLIGLLSSSDPEIPIQAAAELRSFGNTESEGACIAGLKTLLSHQDERTRAIAAVTLGDFRSSDAETRELLQKLAAEDISSEVRDAAAAAGGRDVSNAESNLPELLVSPRS